MSTIGLDPRVIAIITGTSNYVAAVMIVIITAKVPQWVRVRRIYIYIFVFDVDGWDGMRGIVFESLYSFYPVCETSQKRE